MGEEASVIWFAYGGLLFKEMLWFRYGRDVLDT